MAPSLIAHSSPRRPDSLRRGRGADPAGPRGGRLARHACLLRYAHRSHHGGAAAIIEDMLWNFVVDGRPLHILTIFLPTRSPELNPIELVFHILARRSREWRLYGNLEGRSVVKNASKAMDEMSYDLIKRCCIHCGYNLV